MQPNLKKDLLNSLYSDEKNSKICTFKIQCTNQSLSDLSYKNISNSIIVNRQKKQISNSLSLKPITDLHQSNPNLLSSSIILHDITSKDSNILKFHNKYQNYRNVFFTEVKLFN